MSTSGAHPRRRAVLRWTLRVGGVLVAVALAEYFAVHHLAGAQASLRSVRSGAPALLLTALVLEAASVTCYSAMTRALIAPLGRLSLGRVLAVDLTGSGFSHVVPAGGFAGLALRLRLLRQQRVPAGVAVGAVTLEAALGIAWLVAALLVGLLIAVPQPQTHPVLKAAAMITALLVAALGGLLAVLVARPDWAASASQDFARRLPLVDPARIARLVEATTGHLRQLLDNRHNARRAVLLGLGNWALDAGSLYACLRAFGAQPRVGGLITTYALICLLAYLPITPNGVGLVEGTGVTLLISFGASPGGALLGVLAWRLLEFWLPIPVSAGCYVWLRGQRHQGARVAVTRRQML